MTVQELINKLQSLDPHNEVIIEVNHDEIISLSEDRIAEDIVTQDNRYATEEDEDTRKVIVLSV